MLFTAEFDEPITGMVDFVRGGVRAEMPPSFAVFDGAAPSLSGRWSCSERARATAPTPSTVSVRPSPMEEAASPSPSPSQPRSPSRNNRQRRHPRAAMMVG